MIYTKSDYGTRCLIWFDLISGLSIHFNKLYSFPSQLWLLRRAKEWKGVTCSLRTLNRDLKRMVQEGWFKRKRRLTRAGIYAGRFMSTLYILGRKAFKSAIKMGKWFERVVSLSRLPNLANNKSQRENEILTRSCGNVENLWKTDEKGVDLPIRGIL